MLNRIFTLKYRLPASPKRHDAYVNTIGNLLSPLSCVCLRSSPLFPRGDLRILHSFYHTLIHHSPLPLLSGTCPSTSNIYPFG